MKRLLIVLLSLILLISCTSTTGEHMKIKMGTANPASIHCVKNGGKLVTLQQDKSVQYCKFKDGKIIEEWDYFREMNRGY